MRVIPLAVLASAFFLAACDKPQELVGSQAPGQSPEPLAAAKPDPGPESAAPKLQPSASEQLAAQIKSKLRDARDLEAQGVDVTVADGVVTLHGTTPAPEEAHKIATYVAQLDGVRSVVNNLIVVRGS